ncbi:MAG: lipoate--protein ligase family protein [Chloroflexi bacterium]|nr:lipoate--protein ligase family protein [Chloroflexota bacterium]
MYQPPVIRYNRAMNQDPLIYPLQTWRLIIHDPTDGATNMAIDEAISNAVAAGTAPPTLRLYAWEPACLSLGYAQKVHDVDFDRLAAKGWDLVRRPTGGRAILHTDELTYSVVVGDADPRVSGGIIQSYQRLSRALLAGLEGLGTPVASDKAEKMARKFRGPVCFEVPSDYEITALGRKLLGSAQARRRGTVLQHGSLPLYGDITRICDALCFDSEEARNTARDRVAQRAITLESALGFAVDFEEVGAALAASFAQQLNLSLEFGDLAEQEWQDVEELYHSKYGNHDWTLRN